MATLDGGTDAWIEVYEGGMNVDINERLQEQVCGRTCGTVDLRIGVLSQRSSYGRVPLAGHR